MPPSPLTGHTLPHVNCPLCDATKLETLKPAQLGELRFTQASTIWFAEHRADISPKTQADYTQYLRPLQQFFGEMVLRQIHIGHFQQYQKWRHEAWTDATGRTRSAGPSAINHELNTVAQILDRAGLWTEIKRFYKALPQPRSRVGKALKDEAEERQLFDVAATNPRWKVAYWAGLLTANTGAGPNEIRHLRLQDLSLRSTPPYIQIREGLKNDYRQRTLPLNRSALWAVNQLLKRAQRIGCCEPEHYLLPHRARTRGEGWDFNQPIGSWKKAWQSLRIAAGMPTLRMYDLRHHALTKIYEQPEVSEQVATEIAGHEGTKMRAHYSHIRLSMKQKALDAIEVRPGPAQMELRFIPEPVQSAAEIPVEKMGPARVVELTYKASAGKR